MFLVTEYKSHNSIIVSYSERHHHTGNPNTKGHVFRRLCRRQQRIALAELKIMQNFLAPGNKTADINVPSVSHGRNFMHRDYSVVPVIFTNVI